jgi:tRNA pseudouridine13 synthase
VEGIAPDVVAALDLPSIQVVWAERHDRRLKIGHLTGNRFTIRVRGVERSVLATCQAVLQLLEQRGVPNWYGPQRFGQRGDSARLGGYVIRKDAEGFVDAFLGGPHPNESKGVRVARERYDAGDWERALSMFPGNMADEKCALQVLIRTQGDSWRAYQSIPKRLKMFLLSAFQSALFNQVVDARLDTLDQVFAGDLAMKHPGHSVFRVEDEAAEQPRARDLEISPTGPIFGYKMMQASGRQGELEAQILSAEALTLEDFRVGGGIKAKGERRSLRFQMTDAEIWYDEGIVLRFELPKGCYATAVLAEFMKDS